MNSKNLPPGGTPVYSASSPPRTFIQELTQLLDKYSKENGSSTPPEILASHLVGCLELFDKTTNKRTKHEAESQFGYIPNFNN